MKECQSNPKTMKKYMLKGARIGISGSNKYSFGIFHKRKITQLFNANLINYWITECINHNDSSRLHEIKIKTVWHLKRRRERKERKGRKRQSQKITT